MFLLLKKILDPPLILAPMEISLGVPILDLVLTNDEFLVDDVLVHPNAFDSDHHPLTFKLHVKKTRPRNAQRKVYVTDQGILMVYKRH